MWHMDLENRTTGFDKVVSSADIRTLLGREEENSSVCPPCPILKHGHKEAEQQVLY